LKEKQANESSDTPTFFPRIIRDFEDDDEPMMWG